MIKVGDQVRIKNKRASSYGKTGEVVRISPTDKYIVKFANGMIREYVKGSLELWEDLKETESTNLMMGVFFDGVAPAYPDDYDFTDSTCLMVYAYSREHCVKILNNLMEEGESDAYDQLFFGGKVYDLEETSIMKFVD